MPDEARDGRNVALIDKCFMVCSRAKKDQAAIHPACLLTFTRVQWSLSIKDTLNKGHPSNEDTLYAVPTT